MKFCSICGRFGSGLPACFPKMTLIIFDYFVLRVDSRDVFIRKAFFKPLEVLHRVVHVDFHGCQVGSTDFHDVSLAFVLVFVRASSKVSNLRLRHSMKFECSMTTTASRWMTSK